MCPGQSVVSSPSWNRGGVLFERVFHRMNQSADVIRLEPSWLPGAMFSVKAVRVRADCPSSPFETPLPTSLLCSSTTRQIVRPTDVAQQYLETNPRRCITEALSAHLVPVSSLKQKRGIPRRSSLTTLSLHLLSREPASATQVDLSSQSAFLHRTKK